LFFPSLYSQIKTEIGMMMPAKIPRIGIRRAD